MTLKLQVIHRFYALALKIWQSRRIQQRQGLARMTILHQGTEYKSIAALVAYLRGEVCGSK